MFQQVLLHVHIDLGFVSAGVTLSTYCPGGVVVSIFISDGAGTLFHRAFHGLLLQMFQADAASANLLYQQFCCPRHPPSRCCLSRGCRINRCCFKSSLTRFIVSAVASKGVYVSVGASEAVYISAGVAEKASFSTCDCFDWFISTGSSNITRIDCLISVVLAGDASAVFQ